MAEVRDGRTYYDAVWVEGEYREPVYPSALNVRVGTPGIKVITVLRDLRAHGDDIDALIEAWDGYLTRDDVDAALRFYESRPGDREEIDARLSEEASVA